MKALHTDSSHFNCCLPLSFTDLIFSAPTFHTQSTYLFSAMPLQTLLSSAFAVASYPSKFPFPPLFVLSCLGHHRCTQRLHEPIILSTATLLPCPLMVTAGRNRHLLQASGLVDSKFCKAREQTKCQEMGLLTQDPPSCEAQQHQVSSCLSTEKKAEGMH